MAMLNRKITLFTNTPQPNGSGGFSDSWDAGRAMWADIEVTNSGKLFTGSQEYNGTYYTLTVRTQSLNYTPPLENYKIQVNAYNGVRSLKIVSAEQQDLKREWTIVQCIESNG